MNDTPRSSLQLVGYARVSTEQQRLDLQLDALRAAGCEQIFSDVGSGTIRDRPQLEACLRHLRSGDTLVVWRLDRLGRSLRHLVELVGKLSDRGVALRSLTEGIDTTTPTGRMVLHVFGALAEFERELIIERTRAGLEAARVQGRLVGGPRLVTAAKLTRARELRDEGRLSMGEIAKTIGVSRATLYRALARYSTNDGAVDGQRADHE
jgi:DNA invertase Pin-like site-specific DNA recombinase